MPPLYVNGTGDATAALFLAHLLRSGDPAEALSMRASTVHAVLAETRRTGSREVCLVSAQESSVDPPNASRRSRFDRIRRRAGLSALATGHLLPTLLFYGMSWRN